MLELDQNQLTGQIPKELGELNALIYLKLNENRLSGSIPPELGQLVKLQVICLGFICQFGRHAGYVHKKT